jgi:hypothetical protein
MTRPGEPVAVPLGDSGSSSADLLSNKRLEIASVLFVSLVAVVLALYPVFHRYRLTPEGRTYVGTNIYSPDYAGYVSAVEQGFSGRWTHVDKFTSEPLPSTYLYLPYLALGHGARLLGMSAIIAYHAASILFAALFLVLAYGLVASVITPQNGPGSHLVARLTAFALAIGSAAWPVVRQGAITLPRLSLMVGGTEFCRLLPPPHYALGNIVFVGGLLLLIRHLKTGRLWPVLASAVLVLLTTFFRPSHAIAVVLTAGGFTAGEVLLTIAAPSRASRARLVCAAAFFGVNLVALAPATVYLHHMRTAWPTLPYFQYDISPPHLFDFGDWVLYQGPLLFVSFLALPWALKDEPVRILLSSLVVVVSMTFIFPIIVPFHPFRGLQIPLFVPLAILAAVGLARKLKAPDALLSALMLLALAVPTAVLDFDHELRTFTDHYYIWPPAGYIDGLQTLQRLTRPDEVVLTGFSLSNLVPMMSGNTVYWGHPNETLDYDRKRREVERFYKGQMSEAEAYDFLLGNGIRYVLWGLEERSLGRPGYAFLRRVFSNETIDIYQLAASAKGSAFKSIDADFSGRFRLLGVLWTEHDNMDVYRFFWRKTGFADTDLLTFHHFRDGAGSYLHGENVDPGKGWYTLRQLQPGQQFSYSLRVPKALPARRLDIGLFSKESIQTRIPHGAQTYYALDITTLRTPPDVNALTYIWPWR